MSVRWSIAVLLLASAAPRLHAQAAAASDPVRPGLTEDAAVLAPLEASLEAGYSVSQAAAARTHSLGQLLVRVGFTAWSELHVGLNSYVFQADAEGGLEDSFLGVKARLPARLIGSSVEAAVVLGSTLPTGSEEFGEPGPRPRMVLSVDWHPAHPRWSLRTNATIADVSAAVGRETLVEVGGSAGYAVTPRSGLFLQGQVGRTTAPDGEPLPLLLTGVTHLLGEALQLDLWLGGSVATAPREGLAGLMLTASF